MTVNSQNSDIIKKTEEFVRKTLEGEGTGHDWWHIDRVRKNALVIAKAECADVFVVELAALLHDIADWKFHNGDDKAASKVSREWLASLSVNSSIIDHVCSIVEHISFKGANVGNKITTIEGKCVQDADRLDALGAIGIARAFAYGGSKGRELYNPDVKPVHHDSFESYKTDKSHTINHFYEKLLLLKDRMNTQYGKRLADERHVFLEKFLDQFYKEWNP